MSVMLGCRKLKLHAFVAAARALILSLGTTTVRFSLALRISRAVSLTASLSVPGCLRPLLACLTGSIEMRIREDLDLHEMYEQH